MTDALTRLASALADRYRIERELGQGGMATVYLAHDVRHDRPVALKVLRPELAAVIGGERFLAEIKTTAALQHPHILPLHDSGEAEGTVFYVMPYVEGESLRDRIAREHQLPVDEAVTIAREVADALTYAHGHGVIHRDIKPENILLHGGHALVADFGIALAVSRSEGGTRMTETGMSLGTPHYMSPEQAMGEREITPRADVYALGCVLYEMLTGEPPFTGATAQAIIARVMTEEPRSLTLQRRTIPPHVEAAVRQALEKLPADRFATAAAFAEALANPAYATARTLAAGAAATDGASGRPGRRGLRARLRDPVVLGLAAVALAALGYAVTSAVRRPPPATLRAVRFVFSGSDSAEAVDNYPWPAAISPDGNTLVYAVASPGARWVLYARRMDQLEGYPIPGTAGASQPLFSPDGQWLAFETAGQERKVRLDGSAPVTIAEGGANDGADWTTTGELVVGSTGSAHGLSHVSAAGGVLTPLTRPDSANGEIDHLWPLALSDGRTIVFTIWQGVLATAELGMTSLRDGRVTRLGVRGIRPLAVLDGSLVYVQADGAVMAVPLDASAKRVRGSPVPVLDPVYVSAANNGNSGIFISRSGALVTSVNALRSQLTWVSRDGTMRPVSREVRDFGGPRISPDGRRIAVIVSDGSKSDVWIQDLTTGTLSRLTTAESVTSAEWTTDGSHIIYSAGGSGSRAGIWSQSVGVASAPEMLLGVPTLTPFAVQSPDGRSLLLQSLEESRWEVLRVPLDSGAARRPYSTTAGNDFYPKFSPDGRWVALQSDESGRSEIYLRSFPEPTVKVQVSVAGGRLPVWSADGRRLYYWTGGSTVMEAHLTLGTSVSVQSRDTAFSRVRGAPSLFGESTYDITRDGSRIVIPIAEHQTYRLVVVPNWLTEFRERLAANRGGGR